ncbi:MAG: alkaline phosphatase D family protein [Verrucomicrobiae bacterium]|nr:alkaline phosphatase D family protein [Verrucomicrobiae bacterium]NNJ43916.1 alkaline phosphatase [Akkermansiaceae bacterium]
MQGSAVGTAGEVRVTYWVKNKDGVKKTTTPWHDVNPKANFTRLFKLTHLTPGTSYRLLAEGRATKNDQPSIKVQGTFKTAPAKNQTSPVSFTVVTGQDYNRRDDKDNGHQIFREMLKLNPSFFVHTGDVVYYDRPAPWAKDEMLAHFKWNSTYALPFQRKFHNNIASYFMRDDHDITKNDSWPGKDYGDLTWGRGLEIFREQTGLPELPYRTIRWGKDLQIWLVAGRQYRSPNSSADSPEKTIWGAKQKQWLFESVKNSDAAFRLLISPTPIVGPDRGRKNDNHANAGFTHEGDEIRKFVSQQKNMFIICGDRHWQYVSVDPKTSVREYSCGPTSNQHAGGWSQKNVSKMHQYLNVKGGFLNVEISRENGVPHARFKHCGVDGQVYHEDVQVLK